MADIKIDEFRLYTFMNQVKEYVEKTQDGTSSAVKEEAESLLKFIEDEHAIRALRREAETWFNNYKKAKEKSFADECYMHYKEAKYKLNKILRNSN